MKPAIRRSPCPIACALDIFGDRWTLLLIRDLFLGKQRYEEFLASSEGIATNILAARLKLLTEHGLVERLPDEGDKRRFLYHLTERGRSTRQFLTPLVRWGLSQCEGTRTLTGSIPGFKLLEDEA